MFIHLLLTLFIKFAFGDNTIIKISNANEFINFSNNVNSGTNYSGTTVYLDSDLSLSDKAFKPIGNDTRNYFLGVFDGQGHIISNLKMNSSLQITGLFGYSKGLTIRNVVLDSSCSITCNFTGNKDVHGGGLIGECYSINRECSIENIVNMADVTFNGDTNYLFLGGISGYLWTSSSYPVYVKNCVNYGSVTHSGIVSEWSYIGGIAGGLFGSSSSSYIHVYNCLNYGTITHNGISSSLRLGGIVGYSRYALIENCMSAGEISMQNAAMLFFIRSIVGYVEFGTYITHCYYTSSVGVNKVYGYGTPSVIETPTSPSTVNSTLITNLNNYTSKNVTWNKWLLNENNASVSFTINYEKGFTVNSQIVLLPDLANSSERNFSGWYTDTNLTTPFNSSQVESNITLYGMFCGFFNYSVTFDVNGGNELGEGESEMTVGCMSYYGPLPENATRTGHTLIGWFTEREGGDKVETGDKVKILNNHTLYAHWVINSYTVTFDFDNGTIVNKIFAYNASVEYPKGDDIKREGYTFNGWYEAVTNMPTHNVTITALWVINNYTVVFDVNGGNNLTVTSMIVTFKTQYESLPTPTKEGHMFIGWFTDNNVSVKNETIVRIAGNHTLHAHWEEVTTQVEIVFNTKDLTKEDIEEFVMKYTNAKFKITGFEEESGEVKVIIKLTSNKEAENFVENISKSSETSNIKKVGFISGHDASFSTMLYPILFFSIIFFII